MVRVNWNGFRTGLKRQVVTLAFASALIGLGLAQPAAAAAKQQVFDTPEQAADALAAAATGNNTGALLKIFGRSGRKLVISGDPIADKAGRARFAASYELHHEIDKQGDDKATLVIGKDSWPFPIPLVKQDDHWRFDTKAGVDEIVNRRIGRNELNAIQVCRAYYDAQREYATVPRQGRGVLAYAQKFRSTPGKHDGLYWPVKAGQPESPMGPLMASARAEGYAKHERGKHTPYHGYFYKILKRQGKDAPGGAFDYVVKGRMIGGFALVAFPAKYGVSGVMTFIINQDGIVYQKNLGPNTMAIARAMTTYNPDSTWTKP